MFAEDSVRREFLAALEDSPPTGRLAAMESRLQVMLAAVQTVRPALERFYQSLSDEQKARFNAIAPANDADGREKDQLDLTSFCDEKAPGVTDLPIDRIAQAVQPTPAQRLALDELQDASVKAAERLNTESPAYPTLTPTGRVEAMEKRLDAALGSVKTVGPAFVKFYNSLSDEQKARFNSLRSASRPTGGRTIAKGGDDPEPKVHGERQRDDRVKRIISSAVETSSPCPLLDTIEPLCGVRPWGR